MRGECADKCAGKCCRRGAQVRREGVKKEPYGSFLFCFALLCSALLCFDRLSLACRLCALLGRFELGQVELRGHAHAGVDDPLLGDGEQVVGKPVQHQAGREEEEHEAEDQRHDPHHFGLHGVRRYGVERYLQQGAERHQYGQHEQGVRDGEIFDPQNPRGVAHLHAGE